MILLQSCPYVCSFPSCEFWHLFFQKKSPGYREDGTGATNKSNESSVKNIAPFKGLFLRAEGMRERMAPSKP
jgi:hypothetical protein